MKGFIGVALAAIMLTGCATANYEMGKDFSSSLVTQIKKGETSHSQLLSLLGEPFGKTVISADEEKWSYFYSTTSSHAQSYVVTMDVKTTTHQKMLEVLLKDGVVTNYVFNEGDNTPNFSMNHM